MGTLPVAGSDELKQTNEIKMAIPLLGTIGIEGKNITADALLTQRELARYLVGERHTHYFFTVKGNQPGLLRDIELFFQDRGEAEFTGCSLCEHGRIETRRIWTTTELNGYLDFPYVGQTFVIERESINKKSGELSRDIAYGITSRSPAEASPAEILSINRNHWCIENSCHYIIDWNFDEDRGRIRTGHGPVNMSRFRRFAVGTLKSKNKKSVSQAMRDLTMNIRAVFDYLKMTRNSRPRARGLT